MLMLDSLLRGGALAILALLGIIGLRTLRHSVQTRLTLLFDAGAIAYLVETAPALRDSHAPWLLALRLFSNLNPAIFVLWAEAAFNDGAIPRWMRWLPLPMLLLAGLAILHESDFVWHIEQGSALLLVALGLARTLAGRTADLVESRRRARLVFTLCLGLGVAAFIVLGAVGPPGLPAAGGVLALVLAAALLRLPAPAPPPAPPAAAAPEDAGLHARLTALMRSERPYRDDALTLANLAERLAVPEYRLRRLINQTLGHRNFTAFANAWRLDEAMEALSDPAQARVPVLTIALDCGFGSIGPFNRAFKARTGETPSEFRRRVLG
jgi:AraC-like DNA-binding protein